MSSNIVYKIFESPCMSYKEYIDLRSGLPKDIKDILDEAYFLDKEIEYLKTLFRVYKKTPVYYVGRIIERFNRLAFTMLNYLSKNSSEEDFKVLKDEIKNIQKYTQVVLSKGLREPSYTVLYILIAMKLFVYSFVYAPVKNIKSEINSIIANKFCSNIKRNAGMLALPSDILKESK